jgi:hypothetical protein
VNVIEFILIGGGGGGANNGLGQQWAGGSGAIGIYKYINVFSEPLSIAITIGLGGTSGTNGTNGGTTSISFTPTLTPTINVSATGGIGGSSTGSTPGAGGVVTPNNTYFIYSTSGANGITNTGQPNNIFSYYGLGGDYNQSGRVGVLVVTTYS